MSEEIPLKPLGKEEVRKLELALLFGTLFRPDVLEKIRSAEDRLTWLDSLVIAAGALARDRAGYSTAKIAEELGRTESTIRNHLTGKTEAGKIIKETYELLRQKNGRLEIQLPLPTTEHVESKVRELTKKLEEQEKVINELKAEVTTLKEKLAKVRQTLEGLLSEI
ncbi:MAG: transcriptional regulator [Zestosphaera tikiterensis]|uniref:Transcriptional regulator n=1 Tax=Zestosphaera tikiterensis TaxID=1973259 RepID=A0A2R7Y862_9CREN|nr:MAG: transcriptional regulator [Zestosphaera tikiterensis]